MSYIFPDQGSLIVLKARICRKNTVTADVQRATIKRDTLYIKIQFVPHTVRVRYVARTINSVMRYVQNT